MIKIHTLLIFSRKTCFNNHKNYSEASLIERTLYRVLELKTRLMYSVFLDANLLITLITDYDRVKPV